jgi:hypothetical protein
MTSSHRSWYDKGRAHYENCATNSKAKPDYPTQDSHAPADEAEFIRGFQAARREALGAALAPDSDPTGSTWMEGY